ncbi:hypothetical protein AAIB46_10200 [Streptomyces sp. 35M1]|uniref:hypothetical protein n=1 Tax=Streptomyces sp. 35M1 TaxID=3142978 RepID=UPI003990D23D
MKRLRTVWTEAAAPIAAERELLRAVGTGSVALVALWWRWICSADGWDSLWYGLGSAWALAALGWAADQHALVIPVLVVAWLLGALKLGRTADDDTPPDKIEKDVGESDTTTPEDSPETPLAPPTDREFVLGLATLIGTRNGVLLATVVDHFQGAGAPPEWGIPEVRAQCTALGVPVKERIKVRGSTSVGVHRDGLRAALDAGLQPAGNPSPSGDPDPLSKAG